MKVKTLIFLGLFLIFLVIILGFRMETIETNLQWLNCDFNQQKYEEEMEKYNNCLAVNKNVKNQFGFFICGNEPQRGSFFEKEIQYNLVKRRKFKLFGKTILETKRAYPKTCEDF